MSIARVGCKKLEGVGNLAQPATRNARIGFFQVVRPNLLNVLADL